MIYRISNQILSEFIPSTAQSTAPVSEYDFKLRWYHKSGGLKKEIFFGTEENPLSSLQFELNKKICGAGKIDLVFQDFPIHADDYIELYYQNVLKYRAIVDNDADPRGGGIKLIPYSKRFDELLYNGSFSNKTIDEIFETILDATVLDSNVGYNVWLMNTGDTDVLSPAYDYEYIKKIFDDLVGKLNDREWGVTAGNGLTIYLPDEEITKEISFTEDAPYLSISRKIDYKRVKHTRYQVFKKTGSGETTRTGEVGYGSGYPVISLENSIRKKEGKKVFDSTGLSDSDTLDIAYGILTSQQIPENISIKGWDITKLGFPRIGQKISVESEGDLILRKLIYCDALTNDSNTNFGNGSWSSNVSIDTTNYIEGTGSIQFSTTGTSSEIIYDMSRITRFVGAEKIVFMIKSDIPGAYLKASVGNTINGAWSYGLWSIDLYSNVSQDQNYLFEYESDIYIPSANVWALVEIPLEYQEFRYFGIRCFNSTSATINIDDIQILDIYKEVYIGNITKIIGNFTNANQQTIDIDLIDYDEQLNDDIFNQAKQLGILETITQA